jgi:hypothetical protein
MHKVFGVLKRYESLFYGGRRDGMGAARRIRGGRGVGCSSPLLVEANVGALSLKLVGRNTPQRL